MLALDTSTPMASVALGDESALLAETILPMRVRHSESVMPEIARLLDASERDRSSLTGVVVGSGPGSFTGVRVAAAIAKGICFAAGLPLFAFSGLAAVAAGAGTAHHVCALFDARRGQVYAAGFRTIEPLVIDFPPAVIGLDRLLDHMEPCKEWTFAGEAAVLYERPIRSRGARVLPPHLGIPRAASLLWLARSHPELGRVTDIAAWEPEYLRASGAERGIA